MDSGLRPRRSFDIHWRRLDDGGVLLDPRTGKTWSVNDVGLFIWDLCDGRIEVRQIRSELMRYFEIGAEQAQRDIEAFILDLEEQGLLTLDLPQEG